MTVFDLDAEASFLPKQSETCFWADFVELLALLDPDRQFSAGRLEQLLGIRQDISEADPDSLDADDSDVYAQLTEISEEFTGVPDDEDVTAWDHKGEAGDSPREGDDFEDESAWESEAERLGRYSEGRRTRALETFRLLLERAEKFKDRYPFEVDAENMVLYRRDELRDGAEYLFLLGCSLNRYVFAAHKKRMPKVFEAYAENLLRCILPRHQVHSFGTARDLGDPGPFTETDLYLRLQQLARVLNTQMLAGQSNFHPGNTGDGGIDVVAWLDAGDDSSPVLVTLAQCTVGHDWSGKQVDCSFDRMNRVMSLDQTSFTSMLFMSHYYRTKGHAWYTDVQVSAYVVDRFRALMLGDGTVLPEGAAEYAESIWSHAPVEI